MGVETTTGPTRAEHLAWCKKRAQEYVNEGKLNQAFTSMASDLNKHEGTRGHMGMELGAALMLAGYLSSKREMRDFIDGFN